MNRPRAFDRLADRASLADPEFLAWCETAIFIWRRDPVKKRSKIASWRKGGTAGGAVADRDWQASQFAVGSRACAVVAGESHRSEWKETLGRNSKGQKNKRVKKKPPGVSEASGGES
jgi:hypothetical protein